MNGNTAIIIGFALWVILMIYLIKADKNYRTLKDELKFKNAYIEYLKKYILAQSGTKDEK
jgi:hypothetical protein